MYAHALTPPALDAEIRSLVSMEDLQLFIEVMTLRLRSHLDFEAVQAMLKAFVQVHADVLIANGVSVHESAQDGFVLGADEAQEEDEEASALREVVQELIIHQHQESARVLDLLDYCTGVLSFVRDIPLV